GRGVGSGLVNRPRRLVLLILRERTGRAPDRHQRVTAVGGGGNHRDNQGRHHGNQPSDHDVPSKPHGTLPRGPAGPTDVPATHPKNNATGPVTVTPARPTMDATTPAKAPSVLQDLPARCPSRMTLASGPGTTELSVERVLGGAGRPWSSRSNCHGMDLASFTVPLSDGRFLEVDVSGPAGAIPLVVHHGTPGERSQYPPFAAAAAARRLRYVSYSRPGYGSSS